MDADVDTDTDTDACFGMCSCVDQHHCYAHARRRLRRPARIVLVLVWHKDELAPGLTVLYAYAYARKNDDARIELNRVESNRFGLTLKKGDAGIDMDMDIL